MPRKYTGTSDSPADGKRAGTEKLVNLFQRRYGNKVTNLGTWVVRDTWAGTPSTHGTGRAADIGYTDRTVGIEMWNWLVTNSKTLGIEAVHDYVKSRAYRCTRGEGPAGVKTVTDLGPGQSWLHVEISPTMADNPAKFEAAWRSIPR